MREGILEDVDFKMKGSAQHSPGILARFWYRHGHGLTPLHSSDVNGAMNDIITSSMQSKAIVLNCDRSEQLVC